MKCVFCGKEIKQDKDYWGNSCWPIYDDEKVRCCNRCNLKIVIPARIADYEKYQNERGE